MIPGHTKFSPDRFFGMVKRKFRRTRVDSLNQLSGVVNTSTLGRQNDAYVIGHDTTSSFSYYNWSEFLHAHFSILPNITTYHHFRFSSSSPGVVFVREFANSTEKPISILKPGHKLSKNALPSTLQPTGLSLEREKYLYEQIRPFCQEEYRDLTCPLPSGYPSEDQCEHEGDGAPKAKRLCSYCRLPGHTKTKAKKITCPKLL